MHAEPQSRLGQFVDHIEESSIAICLALMTIITFANVVARYVFGSNILWALEATVYLFAWLVLMGASYGVKKQFHIGVDVVINLLPPKLKKIMALTAVGASLLFAVLLLIGSWNYWYPFASKNAWFETNDIPMPEFLQFFSTVFNEGERYEKIPRFIPYMALPLGLGLLTIRLLQTAWKVVTNQLDSIISSHEAEELLEEATLAHPHQENK